MHDSLRLTRRTNFSRLASTAFALLLVAASQASAQALRVSGTVTSSLDGRILQGVRVVVKGAATGTLTGANGRYTLEVSGPGETLVFSLIGYRPTEVAVEGRTAINIALEAAAIMMQDVVVTGYGTQQRRDVTGAVASVDVEDLPPLPTASVEQLLQGAVAGVQVTPSSGRPGDRAIVRFRGVGTLNDASPLYVVDGMLLDDVSYLNPSDIASVEFLKDASATAIYGSRGANGVIILSTKRASLDRPTRFTFRAYTSQQSILNSLDLVNARDYAMLANELAENTGLDTVFTNPDTIGAGTDWQDFIFGTAPSHSFELTSTGGSDRTTFYFSANYFRQEGVLPHSDYNRLTIRANNDYHLTDRLLFGHNLAISYTDGLQPPGGALSQVYRADPTITPRNADGSFADANVRASAGNPAATVFYTRNKETGSRLIGNVFAELNVAGPLTLRSSFGLDYNRAETRTFVPVFFVSPSQQNATSRVTVENGTIRTWLWENTATFNVVTDQHRLNLVGGVTAQSYYDEELGCSRTNIVGEDENLWFCGAGAATGQTNTNSAFDWRMLSYLLRANYTFKDRYLFTGAVRADGSSRFGEANRYGTFPSFAIGWNIKEEGFLRDRGPFTTLKLRASWGQTGNDKIGPYPAIASVSPNQNAVFGAIEQLHFGQTLLRLANPDVQWERTSQTNIGTDMTLLDGRLEATLDYYNRETDGILIDAPIPGFVGVAQRPFVNAAVVRNRGLEATVAWRHTRPGLDVQLSLNGATISNKVLELVRGREPLISGGLGNEITSTTRTVPGQPIGCFYGYRVQGVFQDSTQIVNAPFHGNNIRPGDLRYVDLTANDTITAADQTYLGCPIPDIVYGFGARATWGNFDFAANFSGQAGNVVYNGKKAVRFGVENFETSYLNRWHGTGTSNREPRITNAGHNYLPSDRFIESGSFLKLHTLQVGYRLPPSITSQLRVAGARVYMTGTNLFQLTDYTGYTPEVVSTSVLASGIDLGVFPPARTVTLGLDLTF